MEKVKPKKIHYFFVHETHKNSFRGHFLYAKCVHESIKNGVRGQNLCKKVLT